MRSFAEVYSDEKLVQEVLAQITWYHNITLLEKVSLPEERLWYVKKTIQNGWSRNVLVHQIESQLYHRQGKAITNFNQTLPEPQSELAQQLLKDPYNFDFLNLGEKFLERDLDKALINHIRDFLLELCIGFSFVGSQYHLEVGGEDFYLDLLFFHFKLNCFVVIELKIEEFKPEFSGKMNFYVSAIDDLLKESYHNPTIGIILCKSNNKFIAEYSLRDEQKPIGVSTYQVRNILPEHLQASLPTIEQLEAELESLSIIDECKVGLGYVSLNDKSETISPDILQTARQRLKEKKNITDNITMEEIYAEAERIIQELQNQLPEK